MLRRNVSRRASFLAVFGLAALVAATGSCFCMVTPAWAQTQGIEEVTSPSIAAVESARTAQLVARQLAANPDILVLDFPTLEQQGLMFNRVVAMIERQGAPRERVLSDQELAELIRSVGRRTATFAFGNDFRVSELVKFYNLAEEGAVELNGEETRLKSFLEAKGYMRRKFGFYNHIHPDRVILSLPQEAGADGPDRVVITHTTRNAILRHEVAHGEFYANDDYAGYCERFWANVLTDEERKAFRAFLVTKNYDPNNEELMINETQAYLLHTPDPNVFSAAKVKLTQAAVDALRAKFWAGNPPSRLFRSERQGG
ncbi:MAG: hypothetical protein ABT940_05620 [Alphaproteobacteria bacterium]